jgi:hypothetical protein
VFLLERLDLPLRLCGNTADRLTCFACCSTAARGVDRRDGLLIADNLGFWNLIIGVGSVLDKVAIVGGGAARGCTAGRFALLRGRGVLRVRRLRAVLPTCVRLVCRAERNVVGS